MPSGSGEGVKNVKILLTDEQMNVGQKVIRIALPSFQPGKSLIKLLLSYYKLWRHFFSRILYTCHRKRTRQLVDTSLYQFWCQWPFGFSEKDFRIPFLSFPNYLPLEWGTVLNLKALRLVQLCFNFFVL